MSKEAWLENLLNLYERRLLRYTSRFVAPQVASDIVQEAYLRIWSESPLELKDHEAQWLYRVCRNLALNDSKKIATETRLAPEVAARFQVADSAEMQAIQRENEASVDALIKTLSLKVQEVLQLKFVDGLSYKEISAITGHSISYVGVLIHEGVSYVRDHHTSKSASGKKRA